MLLYEDYKYSRRHPPMQVTTAVIGRMLGVGGGNRVLMGHDLAPAPGSPVASLNGNTVLTRKRPHTSFDLQEIHVLQRLRAGWVAGRRNAATDPRLWSAWESCLVGPVGGYL